MWDLQSIKDMNNGVEQESVAGPKHTYMSHNIAHANSWERLLGFLKTCPDMPIISTNDDDHIIEHRYENIVDKLVIVLQHGGSTRYITRSEGLRDAVDRLIEMDLEIPSILHGY